MPPDPSRLREALLIAREQIAKQQAIIEAQNELILYAFSDGPPGPIDEEAERAAWGWLRVAVDAFGPIKAAPFFRRRESPKRESRRRESPKRESPRRESRRRGSPRRESSFRRFDTEWLAICCLWLLLVACETGAIQWVN